MSAYPCWSLNFDLRSDLPTHVMSVLTDVAGDIIPDEAQLAELHPVVNFYLSDWRRMLRTESPPYVGSPIRLFRSRNRDLGEADCLSIEFCQHDDEHADGGWVFWLWVLSLAHRPRPHSTSKRMIGHTSLYRGDYAHPAVYFVDADGFDLGVAGCPSPNSTKPSRVPATRTSATGPGSTSEKLHRFSARLETCYLVYGPWGWTV
jgi:hypothetical protein